MTDNNQNPEKTAEQSGQRVDAIVRRLDMIAQDMENDAREFDGKPFNGKTVATYFGYQGAAIAALAKIIKKIMNPPNGRSSAASAQKPKQE